MKQEGYPKLPPLPADARKSFPRRPSPSLLSYRPTPVIPAPARGDGCLGGDARKGEDTGQSLDSSSLRKLAFEWHHAAWRFCLRDRVQESSFSTGRVLSTCFFSSQARRATATP